MKKKTFIFLGLTATFCLGFTVNAIITKQTYKTIDTKQTDNTNKLKKENNMKLGAFSISLNVKDINVSKVFYESLGFKPFAGDISKNYLIMKNENSLIGIFKGMFEGNIITFNPGWDENAKNIDKFDDVRKIQQQLKNENIKFTSEADENTSGPASFMLTDPDGNIIFVDQHR